MSVSLVLYWSEDETGCCCFSCVVTPLIQLKTANHVRTLTEGTMERKAEPELISGTTSQRVIALTALIIVAEIGPVCEF